MSGMPGHIELLILGSICVAVIGIPLLVVVVVLLSAKRGNRDDGKE